MEITITFLCVVTDKHGITHSFQTDSIENAMKEVEKTYPGYTSFSVKNVNAEFTYRRLFR